MNRDLTTQIFEAERELSHRENAVEHLRGVPARHNRLAIERLYDKLNALHIARLEEAA